ncbi:MAG: phosphoglycerate mutase (2,3-diphosphoglycerate-independent) [Candidatus Andersenbacteria bacterium RIFCSPHIGHO2_12_FULL_45_11]|uniref:2,3-bisphosphoglycerate-independent phosphoglycerate mutase n=1 Tax=Candidatus Andersenbacteria bacterium RIFCSPHIGHO2_12_FULL_45_11 TaxID=1797281 RepID=A0A1G1X7D3_9BACT|nr:MAG: phosphoglycerate mutase (2,3-diphosphoglycerate-independent) [Candidatus Andersenbacteria bacterium RIFCSPHIGHO2_12_FULL_45_11]
MTVHHRPKPFVMLILDGYGISFIQEGNAIAAAKKPVMDRLMKEYPVAAVRAGGEDVGLPWGEMGNSETGHQNIGSGRVLYQFLPRINKALEDKSFFKNEALVKAINHVKKNKNAALHTMGMLSNGGVHSHINHQFALLQAAADTGIGDRTFVHIFLDGRDSSPDDAGSFVKQLQEEIDKTGAGKIATLTGRYYAMDRAGNWDVTKVAYDMLTKGEGTQFATWEEAVKSVFKKDDKKALENAAPMIIADESSPMRTVQDGDAVIFYNYRSDRARQLTAPFVDPHFKEFEVTKFKDLVFATMASYDENLKADILFPDEAIEHPLGEIFADHKLTQLRIAESEKFAHVTYFFNGGREKPYDGETDVKIPSENTKDFSKNPAMKAKEITDRVLKEIENDAYDVIVMNYANADMVGHTGKFDPTVQAIEYLDEQVGRVVDAVLAKDGAVLLTCDHGKAEVVINHMTHEPSTDHTNNPVPLMYISNQTKQDPAKDAAALQQILATPIGFLADVAPTALDILGLPKPKEMTAQSLLSSLS